MEARFSVIQRVCCEYVTGALIPFDRNEQVAESCRCFSQILSRDTGKVSFFNLEDQGLVE
jgi:hypothetical protein